MKLIFPMRWFPLAPLILGLHLSGSTPGRAHGGPSHPLLLGVDQNHDTLSDVYQALYSGLGSAAADDDGDGQSNFQECAAGTNPFSASDRLDFTEVRMEIEGIATAWPTQAGKQYQLQSSPTLAGPWSNESTAVMGTGAPLECVCPLLDGKQFLRLLVQDVDTDGDGVSDWEEIKAGTDPNLGDTDGDGRKDLERIVNQMGLGNRVNVTALTANGSEAGGHPVVFRISRAGNLNPLTVNYTLGGTAAAGSDYAAPSGKVVFPIGATTATVTLTPIADEQPESAESVILSLSPGTEYTLGDMASASGLIRDSRPGLIGRYFNTQESTYPVFPETNQNFDPAQLKLTRVDGPLDFDWGAGPPVGTGLTNANAWSVRWEGQLIPPVSGNYLLQVQADRGAKLFVDGVLRIDRWSAAVTDTETPVYITPSLTFTAGVPVDIRLDYRETSTTPDKSGIRFTWTPPGGANALIPFDSFTCDPSVALPAGAPVLRGPAFAFALRGAPFSYQITSSPAASGLTADNLPAGLSLDSGTGEITGSTTAPAGLVITTVTGTNEQGSDTLQIPILVIESGGGLTREVWTGLTGSGIASLPLSSEPASTALLTSLEAPANSGDQFGDRLRGFLTVPVSGTYTFFLSGDETSELWISSSGEPGQRLKRSWLTNSGLAPGSWSALPGQRSLQVRLEAGRQYYLEVLRRETTGPDHLSVGWLRPGESGVVPSEVVPGYALSPYVAPTAEVPDGTLYVANLTPQAGAATLGTGTAILFVNREKTAAELSFTFSNLTGPVISQHLHDSRSVPGPPGAIVYDIDDEAPDAFGIRHWLFSATGNHTLPDIIASIESGACYLNLHTNNFPAGEIKGFFQPSTGTQFFTPPPAPPAAELALPSDPVLRQQEIVRFLQQATFGARPDSDGAGTNNNAAFGGFDPDSIEAVAARGYVQWLEDQLAMDPGPDPETLVLQPLPPATLYADVSSSRRTPNTLTTYYNGSGPLATIVRDYYERYPRTGVSPNGANSESANEIWRAWWKAALTAPDQVRHRVAYALSQILVASEDGNLDEKARAVSHYNDLLHYHGLGNFRTLLERVTLNPSMGKYLDMLGNKKPNPATGYIPNENYAREILQLFSIGLKRIHPDGTLVLDSNGLPLPTYDQENVVGFAHTFTGWTYGAGGSANYISPMEVTTSSHDTGEKLLLENAVLPANFTPTAESCAEELKASHDVIFHHPNVGPFLCRQLIQRLVTANPSPSYLYRVASKFDDNGSGVRGDLKAVVRAILLDSEARNQAPRNQPGFGKLKEPVLRATQLLRAFRAYSHAEVTSPDTRDLGAAVFSPNGNLNLALPLRTADITYPGTAPVTVTSSFIDDVIDPDGAGTAASPTTFSFVVAPGNLILLRRQTAAPAGGLVTDANGDTNSPQNGLYRFTDNGVLLTRAPEADAAGELNNAWVTVTTVRTDPPGTPGGSNNTNGGNLTGNRYYQQTSVVATLGSSPVSWSLSSSGNMLRHAWEMGSVRTPFQQNPLQSPTVFNFYEPDYVFLGNTGNAGLYSPEFQITSETSAITTANWFYDLTRRNSTLTSIPFSYGQGYSYGGNDKKEIKLNLTLEQPMASDAGALTDHLASLLLPGQMTPRLRTLLTDYLGGIAANTDAEKMNRLGEALYLISLAPETAVQK